MLSHSGLQPNIKKDRSEELVIVGCYRHKETVTEQGQKAVTGQIKH